MFGLPGSSRKSGASVRIDSLVERGLFDALFESAISNTLSLALFDS
jgi:hypothetical protein